MISFSEPRMYDYYYIIITINATQSVPYFCIFLSTVKETHLSPFPFAAINPVSRSPYQ